MQPIIGYLRVLDRNILLIFLGSLLFQVIQMGVYPILLTQILTNRQVDNQTVGIFVAFSWIAVFVFGPLAPRIIRGFGYRRANAIACALSVLSFLGLAFSGSLIAIALSTVVMGLGLIIRWITCDTWVVHASGADARGRVIGLHEALMGLGIGLGPLMFTGLGLTQIALLCAVLALVAMVAFLFADGRAAVGADAVAELAGPDRASAIATARSYLGLIALALAAAFIAGFVENSSVAMFPLNLEQHGYHLSASAVLVSAFGFGGTLLQPPLGAIADRRGYGFAQGVCAVAVIVSCAGISMFTDVAPILLIAMFFLGGAAGGFNTLAVIEAGQRLDAPRIPAAMTAIAMLYTIGSIVGPVAAGSVMDKLADTGMVVMFAMAATAFAVFLWLRRGAELQPRS